MRSSTLIHAYQRARFLRNVMLVAFGILFAATLLWVMPWVPWGLTNEDYPEGAGVAVALAFGAWIAGFGAVYLRDQTNRYEQTLVTFSSVHDELGDLRRREYFYERAVIECMRSERNGVSFGVFAIRFGMGESVNSAETATALEALAGLIRQTDSLAALGPQEVGVVAAGMGSREAPGFAYRLKSTLEKATGATDSDQVSVGWAIWLTDGFDADTLVGIARSRMQRKSSLREWARELDSDLDEPDETATSGGQGRDDTAANGHLRVMPKSQDRRDESAA
jgi:GGDEF domain-containing protein